MSIYQYKARNRFGKLVSGVINADLESIVVDKLKEAGLIPISIKKEVKKEDVFNKILNRFRRVKPCELNMFTRQFAVLQKAGVNIILSLNSLKDQTGNKIFKEVLESIANDIKQGKSLAVALERYPDIFNPLYTNMVKIGEESGTIVEVLARLADLGEYEEKVQMRIKAATRYPIIVVSAIVIAFLILTILVVPRFAKVYSSSGVALPIPTLILIGINYVILHYWWALIILLGAFIFGFNKIINTKNGRFWWDNLRLKVPVLGPLMTKIIMGRFCRVTGTMMATGVNILRILELASSGVGNVVVSGAIDNIKIGVKEGRGIAESMKTTGLFPPVVIQMVSVGEETGKVDELLLHVSNYYDSQTDYIINNLTSLIEPFLLLVLGGGVLLMALGIFLPMWNLMSLFKR